METDNDKCITLTSKKAQQRNYTVPSECSDNGRMGSLFDDVFKVM